MASQWFALVRSARALAVMLAVSGVAGESRSAAGVRGQLDFPQEAVAVHAPAVPDGSLPQAAVFEVTLPVSFRVTSGDSSDVRQIEVELVLDDERVQLAGYEPLTSLATDTVGEIEEKTTVEDSRSWGGALSTSVPIPGLKAVQVGPSANISDSARTVRTETLRRRPKMDAIVVAGNTARGRGVFFQLRPGTEVTLEGAHHFTLRIVAPRDLAETTLSIKCRAVADEDWILFDRTAEVARTRGKVKLFFAFRAEGEVAPPITTGAIASDREEPMAGSPEVDAAPPEPSTADAHSLFHHTQRPCPWCDEELDAPK